MDYSAENHQLSFRRQKKPIILAAAAAIVVILFSSASAKPAAAIPTNSETNLKLSLAAVTRSLSNASVFMDALQIPAADKRLQKAVSDCKFLLGHAIYQLKGAAGESYVTYGKMSGVMSWLSAAIANQKECLEGLGGTGGGFLREKAEAAIASSKEQTSSGLAVAAGIIGAMKEEHAGDDGGGFPDWATRMQRTFLLGEGCIDQIWTPNVTVAQDGSGQVRTIQEALNLVPAESATPFLIHVKAGVYAEYAVVDINKWNVYMIGDGADKTIVTGNRNPVDSHGMATRDTATFSVSGRGFVAKGIAFRNTAGPQKIQAVALFSSSDQSIFYSCSFDAYQDTLFAHSNRQFYRECDIIGTVDFIFGNAAAVFQKCNILPREPLPYQSSVITAHGRDQPTENTGFSIHQSTIAPYDHVTRPTYLGRAWQSYATVVIMKTEISSIVDPAGWTTWDGSPPPGTIYFGEFQNTGPGASSSGRVNWAGCSPAISVDQASKFTVRSFINGAGWISASCVPFQSNL